MSVAIQAALYSALNTTGLTVYDAAPQKRDGGDAGAFPYVEIGAIVVAEFDTASEVGFDYVARIHTRSRSGSMLECKTIQDKIYARLHIGDLNIPGFANVLIRRESSFCERSGDGGFHGICEYRGMTERQ
jgi:hypothetical protein